MKYIMKIITSNFALPPVISCRFRPFFSVSCSQTPSNHVLAVTWQTKFHTHKTSILTVIHQEPKFHRFQIPNIKKSTVIIYFFGKLYKFGVMDKTEIHQHCLFVMPPRNSKKKKSYAIQVLLNLYTNRQ